MGWLLEKSIKDMKQNHKQSQILHIFPFGWKPEACVLSVGSTLVVHQAMLVPGDSDLHIKGFQSQGLDRWLCRPVDAVDKRVTFWSRPRQKGVRCRI